MTQQQPACETASVEQNEQGRSDDEHGKSGDEAKHESGEDDDCAEVESTSNTALQAQAPAVVTPANAAPAVVTPANSAPAAVTPANSAPSTGTTPASGVKGASKTIAAPAASSKPSSGVLGTAKALGSSATTGTLPFTGLRLWIVELIALGLIGGGVAMRLIARRRTT